jgi:hypothetical protein
VSRNTGKYHVVLFGSVPDSNYLLNVHSDNLPGKTGPANAPFCFPYPVQHRISIIAIDCEKKSCLHQGNLLLTGCGTAKELSSLRGRGWQSEEARTTVCSLSLPLKVALKYSL